MMRNYLCAVFALTMLFSMDVKAIENRPTIHDGDTLEFSTFIRPGSFNRAAMCEGYVAWGLELIDPIPPVTEVESVGGGVSLNVAPSGGLADGYFSFDITGDQSFSVFVLNEDVGSNECKIRIYYFPTTPGHHFAKLTMNCSGRTPKVVTLKGYARLAGDMDLDNVLDVSDVVGVIDTILGTRSGDRECADIDGNDDVDVFDVTTLINELLNAL